MNYQELIETLTFLKENRKLGSEADEMVLPFQGKTYFSSFRFESLSRTFANPHDPLYEGGQTLVGDLIGTDLDFSLLLPPTENEWMESLERGEEFDGSVKFLGFDGLYQRGIFGYLGKLEIEETDDSLPVEIKEEQVPDVIEDGKILPDESPDEKPIPEKLRDESPAKIDELPVEGEKQEPESIPVIEPEPVEQSVEVKEETHPSTQAKDRSEKRNDLPVLPPEKPKIKKVLVAREYSKVVGRSAGSEVPPPPAEKSAKAKTKVNAPADRWEIERIRDKKYEHGIESLTQEERVIYDKEQVRRKSKTQGREKKRKTTQKSAEKDTSPSGCRLFITFFLGICALITLGNKAVGPLFFFVLLSAYSIHPWVIRWSGNDPCEEMFKHRLLKEPSFRRGIGFILLSLCMFGTFKLFAVLLLIPAINFIYKSKTFKTLIG